MRRRHGDIGKLLIGNEVVVLGANMRPTLRIRVASDLGEKLAEHGIALAEVGNEGEQLFRFDHMFGEAKLPPYNPDPKALIALGNAMANTATDESMSDLPAGYTFLGQFIDHDLTFNANPDFVLGGQPVQPKSKRSPTLDLDSLYGLDPEQFMNTASGKKIYDGVKFIIGETEAISSGLASTNRAYLHDLPRLQSSREAALVDERNDENLATAQTHLAFIKFHNAIVDHLAGSVPADELFQRARERVVQQYQKVILHDFLPTILHLQVIDEMQNAGPNVFSFPPGQQFMPLEFAFAAFRMGHSLVTSKYEWNRVFQSDRPQPQPASLEELFIFSGSGTFANHWKLPSNWIIDWTRFFDFSGLQVNVSEPSSRAGTIDAVISQRLTQLAPIAIPIPNHNSTRSLAVRNLLRGLDVGLPAGQDIAKHLGYPELKPTDFADLPYFNTLHGLGFDEKTPLWLYILHEAKVQSGGERLGLVGSRIVAETLIKLIQASHITILPPGTKWQKPSPGEKFGMANLLVFVNEASPNKDFLNPLG